MSDQRLTALQAVRLKGRATPEDVAAVIGASEAAAAQALAALVADELCVEKGGRFRLAPAGKERLQAWLDDERAQLDADAIAALYEEFTDFNSRFKQIATDWQQRDGAPNDHSDADYDAAVLHRLCKLHADFAPLVERIAAAAPRLGAYPQRFAGALEKVRAGDHAWFLRPLVDSYHTVWFELHEDLIGLAGHTRAAEAAAGRAQ